MRKDGPLIGAHVKGGLKGAVASALEIGAQAMQIFIGSPQSWKEPTPAPHDFTEFRKGVEQHRLGPVFVHGNYLVNLASASDENRRKSINNLSAALRMADHCGAKGLIFHPGSAGKTPYKEAIAKVIDAIALTLKDYTGSCRLLLEVCAGQGETIGDNFSELADVLKSMGHDKRLGICWDTCHLFNAGYDVATEKGLAQTIEEFDDQIGFEWLVAVHANDSKNPLGARRDRHENIGQGQIGEKAFARMLHNKHLRKLPWILEVPGFAGKGPDRENIEILHRLAN